MKNVNRQHTAPVSWPKSKRGFPIEVGTSLPAGKVVPVFATHLLRHDTFKAHVNFNIEMGETNELLANPTRARVSAYLVPDTALERFEKSRDQFDKSYMGEPQIEGGSVIPFYDYDVMGAAGVDKIYQHLGLDAPVGTNVETGYVEAYNLIQNFRLRNRSRDVFGNVLPSFDTAVAEGQVALNVISQALPVKGLGKLNATWGNPNTTVNETAGISQLYPTASKIDGGANDTAFYVKANATSGLPELYAEMEENGITVSLDNIDLAKKLQTWAKVRERYTGLADDEADEYVIDMLISGYRIPDKALMQPILLNQQMMTFSQGKRYASDSGNLDDSAVSGFAGGSMSIRVPELEVGGMVMVVVECFPQQLFERQADPRFNNYEEVQALEAGLPQTAVLPDAMADHLDPEKVDVIYNRQIDTGHSAGGTKHGYAPLNWKWTSNGPRLGGKFHQAVATTSDRQRFWAAETVDPVLGQDFFMVPSDLQTDVFLRTGDPFELFMSGSCQMHGLTQFGGLLIEQTENYETLEDQADSTRIDQEAV